MIPYPRPYSSCSCSIAGPLASSACWFAFHDDGEIAVDLPHLPHSYRKSFDASRLTRRRRSIQHFLEVALKQEALRDCDALVDFLSPEG